MHSTMVAGGSRNPGKRHLLKLANTFGIKNPETILQEVKCAISSWNNYAAGVTKNSRELIAKTLSEISKN